MTLSEYGWSFATPQLGRTAEQRRALFFTVGRRLEHMRPRRIIAVFDAYWKAGFIMGILSVFAMPQVS